MFASLLLDLRKLAADYPAIPGYRSSLANALRGMGTTLWRIGRPNDSEQAYRESVAIHVKLAEGPHATSTDALYLSESLMLLARVVHDQGRHSEAQQIIGRAMATIEPARKENPGNYAYQRTWHRAMRRQVGFAAARGDHAEAAHWIGRVAASENSTARDRADCGLRLGQLTWLVWRDGELGRDEQWRLTQSHASRAIRLFATAGVQLCRDAFVPRATATVKGIELEE